MGNRRSVQKALERRRCARADHPRSGRDRATPTASSFPGVGAFPQAMGNLPELGLDAAMREHADSGRPLLGICLGMQLLFEALRRVRRHARASGLIAGEVTALRSPAACGSRTSAGTRCASSARSPLTAGLPAGGVPFYHVHSLAVHPADPERVVGTTEYGERFATIVPAGPVHGVQFHPEKSSRDGLRMLARLRRLCVATRRRRARGRGARPHDPAAGDRHPRRPRGAAGSR